MHKTIVNRNEHRITKAERIKKIVSKYADSGKIVAQYGAAKKIKEKIFYNWLRKYVKANTAVLTKPTI